MLLRIFTLLIMLSRHATISTSGADVAQVHRDLLSGYNRMVRPRRNQSDTVVVSVDIGIQSIKDLDEQTQILWINAHMGLSWEDEYLTWNPSHYGGVHDIILRNDQIWIPDVVIYNSVDAPFDIGGNDVNARVYDNGTVMWYPGGRYRTLCPVDVRKYPFDVQTCHFEVIQWYNYERAQKLVPASGKISYPKVSSNEWQLIHSDVDVTPIEAGGETYSVCRYSLTLARQPLFVLLNVVSPVVLLSFLNVLVFRLPAASGEKMTLCISVMISFAVFVTAINEVMPKVSTMMSYLEIYLSVQLAVSGLTTVTTVWILEMYYRPYDQCVPTWLQRLVQVRCPSFNRSYSECQGNCTRVVSNVQVSVPEEANGDADTDSRSSKITQSTVSWELAVKCLDRLFFWMFLMLAVVSTATLCVAVLI